MCKSIFFILSCSVCLHVNRRTAGFHLELSYSEGGKCISSILNNRKRKIICALQARSRAAQETEVGWTRSTCHLQENKQTIACLSRSEADRQQSIPRTSLLKYPASVFALIYFFFSIKQNYTCSASSHCLAMLRQAAPTYAICNPVFVSTGSLKTGARRKRRASNWGGEDTLPTLQPHDQPITMNVYITFFQRFALSAFMK